MTGPLQALAKLEKGGMITRIGFVPRPGLTYRRFEALCVAVREARESVNFVAGDLIIAAEQLFGDEGYQAIEELGLSHGTKQQCVRVAERIPIERRRRELSWSHHRSVVAFEPEEQDRWLNEAVNNAWSKGELEDAIRGEGVRQLEQHVEQQATTYVVEPVLTAAERVYAQAEPMSDTHYTVPAEPLLDLGRALGVL